MDFAVDAQHRQLRPAILLARAVTDYLSEERPLIWGLPNHRARAIFHRVGYREEGERQYFIKSLHPLVAFKQLGVPLYIGARLSSFLDRAFDAGPRRILFHRSRLEEIAANDPRIPPLLAHPDLRAVVHIERTPEYLQWRYEQCPLHRYFLLGITDSSRRRLIALIPCFLDRDRSVQIDDFVFLEAPWRLDYILESVLAWAEARIASSVSIEMISPPARIISSFARCGFTATEADRSLCVLRHPRLPVDFRIHGPELAQVRLQMIAMEVTQGGEDSSVSAETQSAAEDSNPQRSPVPVVKGH